MGLYKYWLKSGWACISALTFTNMGLYIWVGKYPVGLISGLAYTGMGLYTCGPLFEWAIIIRWEKRLKTSRYKIKKVSDCVRE